MGTGDRGWGHAPSSQSARCSSRPGWHSTESLIKGAAARVFARPFAFGWVLGNWLCAGVVLQLRLTSALSKSEMYTATRSLFFSYNKKMNRFKAPKRKKNNQRGLLTLRFSFFKTLSCKSSSLAAGQEQRTLCQPHACGLKARAMLSTCHLKNRACVVANQECVPSIGPATVSWATTAVKNATLKPPKSEVLIQKRCLFLSGEADHWNGCCCTALHFYKAHSTWGMDPFCWTVQADSDDILE